MTKSNYAAWQINATEFSNDWNEAQKLEFFARYAILAPSGHNTQPWDLVLHEDSLDLSINKDHFLPIDGSGLTSVEPYISLGTFVEAFVLAARGFGYKIAVFYPSDDKTSVNLQIDGRGVPEPRLLNAITTRVSNRNPFDTEPLPDKLIEKFQADELRGVEAKSIKEPDEISFIADQTAKALQGIMSKPEYRKELSKWVRSNHTARFDGMPGNTHGFNDVQSIISKLAIRYAPGQGPGAEKSRHLIQESGTLIVVSCKDEQTETFINAGRLFTRICVLANEAGFASSALGASVLDPDTRTNMKKYFNLKNRPVYLLRLGKATATSPHSPRWPLSKLLHRAV